MKCNVGKSEQIIRIAVGVAIIAAGVMFGSWWGLVGLVPLVTGITRWCPAYMALRIDTAKGGH